MGKVMRHTLGASLNIRHNLSSSKGPKPLQLKLLTTYIPKTSAFTLAFSTSQRLRTTRASRSEERRVGKECRCRWSPDHEQQRRRRHLRKGDRGGPTVQGDGRVRWQGRFQGGAVRPARRRRL